MKTSITPQAYGAAENKSIYVKNLRRGLEYAVILHIALFSMYFLINYANNVSADNQKPKIFDIKEVIFNEPPPPIENEIPEQPKVNEQIKNLDDAMAKIPEPVSRNLAEQMTIKTQDELNNIKNDISSDQDDNTKYVYNPDNGNTKPKIDDNITIKNIKDPVITNENKDYTGAEVESLPECVNLAQIQASLVYPEIAISGDIQGKVVARVLVSKEGRVIKVGNITGPEVFHDEVKTKVKNLEFTPGMLNNKTVNVWVNIPFSFRLQD
jgi:TonB family protein